MSCAYGSKKRYLKDLIGTSEYKQNPWSLEAYFLSQTLISPSLDSCRHSFMSCSFVFYTTLFAWLVSCCFFVAAQYVNFHVTYQLDTTCKGTLSIRLPAGKNKRQAAWIYIILNKHAKHPRERFMGYLRYLCNVHCQPLDVFFLQTHVFLV